MATGLAGRAADVGALAHYLETLAPGATLPRIDGASAHRGPITRHRLSSRRGRPERRTSQPARPRCGAGRRWVADVFGAAAPTELLIDLAVDLRAVGGERVGARTVGPLQAKLEPRRVDLTNPSLPDGSNPTLGNGPGLDVLRYLSPQVGAALTEATAAGQIVEPDVLVGDHGLPTAHSVSIRLLRNDSPDHTGWSVIVDVDAEVIRTPTPWRTPSPTSDRRRRSTSGGTRRRDRRTTHPRTRNHRRHLAADTPTGGFVLPVAGRRVRRHLHRTVLARPRPPNRRRGAAERRTGATRRKSQCGPRSSRSTAPLSRSSATWSIPSSRRSTSRRRRPTSSTSSSTRFSTPTASARSDRHRTTLAHHADPPAE